MDDSGLDRGKFIDTAYTVFDWMQAILNIFLLCAYLVIFIWFIMLICREKERLGTLLHQVVSFFTIMLMTLTLNFALLLFFYIRYNAIDSNECAMSHTLE